MYFAWLNIRLSHLTLPTEFMMGFSMNLGLGLSVVLQKKNLYNKQPIRVQIKMKISYAFFLLFYPLMWNLNSMNPNIVARIVAKRRANWTTERPPLFLSLPKLPKMSVKDAIAASETYRRS